MAVFQYTLVVSYNANGGSGAPSYQTFQTESAANRTVVVQGVLSSIKPIRNGYKFVRWYDQQGQSYYNSGGTISQVFEFIGEDQTKSIELKAVWQKIDVPSTFGTIPSSVTLDGSTSYTFNINKSADAHHHSMSFDLGEQSAVYQNIDSSKSLAFPLSWNSQIINSESSIMTVTLTSYAANNNQIGDPEVINITANVPDSIIPTLTITHSTVNDDPVVSGWGILLQGYSKISFSASAAGVYGSTISAISFSGPNLQKLGSDTSAVSDILTSTGSQTWTVTAVDSRGRSNSVTYTETIYAYAVPTIKYASAKRCNQDGSLNEGGGQYGRFRATVAFSSANGNNQTTETLEYREHGSGSYTTIANAYLSDSNVVFGNGLLLLDESFDVRLTVTDAIGNQAVKIVMLSSVSGFAIGLKNDRARFGGVPVRPGLQIDWPVYAPKFVQSGSVYPASVNSGATKTVSITFDAEFASAPNVVVGLYSSQTIGMGQCSASVWDISKTGFSLRITNGYSSARDLGAFWIASI